MKEKRQYIRLCSIAVVLCLITGCGPNNKKVTFIDHDTYEKMTYDTVEVKRGDLEPSMSLTLTTDSYEMIQYGTNNQELKLDKVYSVLDKAHRVQLTDDVLEQAGITTNKVRIAVEDGKVVISAE